MKTLQKEVIAAEKKVAEVEDAAKQATQAYNSASDERKPETLIQMLEAKAAAERPRQAAERLKKDFTAAQQAYVKLLLEEPPRKGPASSAGSKR